MKSIIESTLLSSTLAYWDLVLRLENLHIIIENMKEVKHLVEMTHRLYEVRRAKRYGKAEIDAELARLKDLEEIAWDGVVRASNAMAFIMDDEWGDIDRVIYIPSGYSQLLQEPLPFEADQAVAIGISHRPDLKARYISRDYSEIRVKYGQTLNRPDLFFTGSYQTAQNASTYGYKSFEDSLSKVFHPDSRNQAYSLGYRYPWGKRGEKAFLSSTMNSFYVSDTGVKLKRNDVVREIKNGIADVSHSRERIIMANHTVELAAEAFERLKDRFERDGSVDKFELILKSRALLDAKFKRISALIESKKAELGFLHALGVIANKFPEMTARNAFDQYRIGLLSANNALSFFKPVTGEVHQ